MGASVNHLQTQTDASAIPMHKRKRNRDTRKRLRYRERKLKQHLRKFLDQYDPANPVDIRKLAEAGLFYNGYDSQLPLNFYLLRSLRWFVNDVILFRLHLNRHWQKKKLFLELFDVDQVSFGPASVELIGDIVWWVEGRDAVGEWWPPDHEPHKFGKYKVLIRGEGPGGYWVVEPVTAKLTMPKSPKRDAQYEIRFGYGSTFMKFTNKCR